MLKEFAQTQK